MSSKTRLQRISLYLNYLAFLVEKEANRQATKQPRKKKQATQ